MLTVEGSAPTVTVGDTGTEQSAPKLHLKDKKSTSNFDQPTLTLEGDFYGPGIDFRADGSRVCRMRPDIQNDEFEILPEGMDVRVGNSGWLYVEGKVNAGSLTAGPTTLGGKLDVRASAEVFDDLNVRGTKNFVQSVNTETASGRSFTRPPRRRPPAPRPPASSS